MLLQKQQLMRKTQNTALNGTRFISNKSNEETTVCIATTKSKKTTKENANNYNCCNIATNVQQNTEKLQRITALDWHVPQQKEIITEQQQQSQPKLKQIKQEENHEDKDEEKGKVVEEEKHTTKNIAQKTHLNIRNFSLGNMLQQHQANEAIVNKFKTTNILPINSTKIKQGDNNNNSNNNKEEYNMKVANNNNHQKAVEEYQQQYPIKQQEKQEKEQQQEQEQEQPQHQNQKQFVQLNGKKKTIDFNSRRRRGRLRLRLRLRLWLYLMDCPLIVFALAIATKSYNSIVPAICNKIRLATLKQHVAYHIMLLLSLLLKLTFIVDYVNSKKLLLLSLNASINAHIRQMMHATMLFKNIKNDRNNNNMMRKCSNSKKKNSIIDCNIKYDFEQRLKRSTAAISSTPYATAKLFHCNNMRFIYAFLICILILLLPCSDNVVNAAKPKSATQLQKQHQQHQQDQQQMQELEQQQQTHLTRQHVAGVAFDSHGNGVLTPPSYQVVSSQSSNEDAEFLFPSEEQLFDEEQEQLNANDVDEGVPQETQSSNVTHDNTTTKTPLFPKDLFTKEQLENGAVIFHVIGVIYMFVALAIVCDEFFVPSLDVIIEKLGITDDVAGATFMAAGGSAPELFTSVIGVFVSFDDVGIGTIVGSAVFNILFVIGMCALFSRTVLSLTWWPLFRDCSFYSISLLVLIYFFRDNRIYWWEALILFSIYVAYVAFMKWNVQVERCVKRVITKNKVTRVRSTDQLMPAGNAANSSETSMATQPGGSVTSRAASETRSGPPGSSSGAGTTGNSSGGTASSTQTGAKFRHGLLQLMIHTIDPLHDDDVPGKVDEKATQLHAIASLKVLLDATKPQRGAATTSAANHVKINLKETTLADRPNGNIDTTLDSTNEIEEEPEPLSMAWPDTARKRLTYILVAPLLIPMWLTLPDTRTPRGKKYFPVTFIGSILWIAAFSYLMVWWANVIGDTARIPPEVMGLTFLAAGTSIPDLITSVIVARKGFGDMAVSSSVGSNIFDVTVGLPIPWLIFGIIYSAPVEVNSVGMVCSITILFMMLLFVVMSIACFRWRMNKGLGFTMFLLYFVFVAVSLMFEYDMISCPV